LARNERTPLGELDLVCAVFLALGTATIYPFIRFRAAFGIGFLGLLFGLQDQPLMALLCPFTGFQCR